MEYAGTQGYSIIARAMTPAFISRLSDFSARRFRDQAASGWMSTNQLATKGFAENCVRAALNPTCCGFDTSLHCRGRRKQVGRTPNNLGLLSQRRQRNGCVSNDPQAEVRLDAPKGHLADSFVVL